ncbi:MAG: redoxin domain-containing protein [Caldilineaceae bacterium]
MSGRALFKATAGPEILPTQTTVAAPSMTPPKTIVVDTQPMRSQVAATSAIPSDQVLVQVNDTVLSQRSLQIAVAADRAIAQLLNTPFTSDPATALERVVNDTLVQQAAYASGMQPDQATIEERLQAFLDANHKSSADLEEALSQVQLLHSEFEEYFAHLLLVNSFVRTQAQKRGISDDAYLAKLQQGAQISFGPAAPNTLLTQSDLKSSAKLDSDILGKIIPFTLPVLADSDASNLTRTDLDGHPAVLLFSTSWCTYCPTQTEAVAAAQAAYVQQGVQFIEINVKEQQAVAQAYFTQNQIAHPVALDEDGAVAAAYHVTGFPTTFFLDAQGRVTARQIGVLTATQLTAQIQRLLTK